MKNDIKLKDLTAVILTFLVNPDNGIRGFEPGVDYFVNESYDEQKFLSRIENFGLSWKPGKSEPANGEVEIIFDGRSYILDSNRKQVLNVLLSAYEDVIGDEMSPDTSQTAPKGLNENPEIQIAELTAQLKKANRKLEAEQNKRKETENRLLQEQRRLKEIQSLGKLGNWEYDIDTGEIFWAEETYAIYERDPALGPPTKEEEAEYYSDEQVEILKEYAKRVIENKEYFRYDFNVKIPNGKEKNLTATMSPIVDENGRVIKLFGTVQDITERKQAEELYTNITTSSPVGIYIYRDGKFRFVNKQFQLATGFSEAELLDMNPTDLVYIEDREKTRANATEMIKGRRVSPYEFRVITHDGEKRWAMETVTSIHYEGKRATLGNFMDITENKQAEEALTQTEEKLRITIDSVPQGILVTDMDGNITQVNKSAVVMFGYESDEDMIGRRILNFIAREYHSKILSNIFLAVQNGRATSFECSTTTRNGRTFLAEMALVIIKDNLNKPTATLSVIEDITERKKMQEQLMVTDRLASVGELAAGIAHELNNPLTGVIGFSDLLMKRNDVPDDLKEDLTIINKEALRASQVARHLLTFARKHPDEKQEIDVNEIIQLVLNLRAYEQRVNNIKVVSELDENLPLVTVNDFQLQQVFINIIINAEHFMIEEHGRGVLTIRTEQAGHFVRISISDDGPGISPEYIGHIFDPFFTTKEVGKGTGLGLSICYGIINEHGGKIRAESEMGKGVTFIIDLPVSDRKE